MRELTLNEMEEVSGGSPPWAVQLAGWVAGGIFWDVIKAAGEFVYLQDQKNIANGIRVYYF
jgi:lactobin A/cerein 7B family class IIb bacteriocin